MDKSDVILFFFLYGNVLQVLSYVDLDLFCLLIFALLYMYILSPFFCQVAFTIVLELFNYLFYIILPQVYHFMT